MGINVRGRPAGRSDFETCFAKLRFELEIKPFAAHRLRDFSVI